MLFALRNGASRDAPEGYSLTRPFGSSSASGNPSHTRRSICAPTPACPRRAPRSVCIWTNGGLIRAWGGKRPIKPASMRCSPFRSRHNQGQNPLGDSPTTVQTNRAIAVTPARAKLRSASDTVTSVIEWRVFQLGKRLGHPSPPGDKRSDPRRRAKWTDRAGRRRRAGGPGAPSLTASCHPCRTA